MSPSTPPGRPRHLRRRTRRARDRGVLPVALVLAVLSGLWLTPRSTGEDERAAGEGGRPASGTSRAAAPASPQAPAPARHETPAVGVQFHGMWDDYTDAQRIAVLDKMAAAGLRSIRVDMGWSSFEEGCRACFNVWYRDRADFVVDAARARGLNVLVTVWRTPGWANNHAGELAPPTSPADFGSFMSWLASRFRGRVSAYEIWNEPDSRDFFTGSTSQYVDLVRAAHPAVKSADPDAQVVLGGPIHNNTDWLRSVYQAGAQGSFDVLATHPYMGPTDLPPETPDVGGRNIYLLTHVAAVHDLMVSNGDGAKPIWFTELGWSSHGNAGGEANWERGVTPEQQADYTVRAIRLVASRFPYVTNMILYNERNRGTGDVQLDNYGILNRDLSEKPVYRALRSHLAG
jgi:polysaccharide biosynthesis protein PslG